MSRMVREHLSSGLQERLWFARWSLRELEQRQQQGETRGPLLALRAAAISQGYSALVGLARLALQQASIALPADALTLASLEALADDHGLVPPAVELLRQARSRPQDDLCWLEGEFRALFAASGLSRRPRPPQELALIQDDPEALLSEGDLARLHQALNRVEALIGLSAEQLEEW